MEPLNISFFIVSPFEHSGIIIDNSVIFGITVQQFIQLSENEKEFISWYLNEQQLEGLDSIQITGNSSLADMSQEDICGLILNLIESETIPDPEIF